MKNTIDDDFTYLGVEFSDEQKAIMEKYNRYTMREQSKYMDLLRNPPQFLTEDEKKSIKEFEEYFINFRMECYKLTRKEAEKQFEEERRLYKDFNKLNKD